MSNFLDSEKPKLSKEQAAEIIEEFPIFDSNGDGVLDK